ncbi:HMG domain-containing protein 3 [Bombina bombina]|uniref:HMG domain-containing protein 3 n=1 Tax=Bombina bombina TaxID=8345 RepID=UPI00235A6CC9|nr:HMG domain-containing protein 3 [Bombina bombina]
MDAPFDGTEVTVVTEEMEGNFVPAKPPLKKKKYRSCAERGETVKKPRSAFLLYYYDIYLKVQQELPHLPQSELNKKISESWKLLSVAEKSFYLERAKLEKEGLDSNIQSSSSTMVSDVPGFRKILPRSEFFLIPKKSPNEERVIRQHLELCMTQSQGAGVTTIPVRVSQKPKQKLMSMDPGQVGLTEQGVDIGELAEDGAHISSAAVVQEVLHNGVFSQYDGSMTDKLNGDIILDDGILEMGNTTSVVIEENGGIALARSEVPAGMSVLTVLSIQDPEENNSIAPATQYFVVPTTSHAQETPRSIKLATTYTRRGRGSCTNPSCSFTYVTRHKPPRCPLCDKFLGGKWIPKVKQPKGKAPSNTCALAPLPDRSEALEQHPIVISGSKLNQESTEAVSQLLHASPTSQEQDWEEVVISDCHLVTHCETEETNTKDLEEKSKMSNRISEDETTEKVESTDKTQMKHSAVKETRINTNSRVNVPSSPPSSTKGQDIKSTPRSRTTLLGSARPKRAILPAPPNSSRVVSGLSTSSSLAIMKTEKQSSITAMGLKPSTLKQLGHSVQPLPMALEIMAKSDPSGSAFPAQVKLSETFPSYKYGCNMALDLGLATLRGRGKCKNPFCDYKYTNRHKPKTCPNCGSNLSRDKEEKTSKNYDVTLVVPSVSEPLSQSQKEIQRQSTIQLLRKTVQIPENESELAEAFNLIQELNSSRLVLSKVREGSVTIEQTSWASFYESPAVQCHLCESLLFKGDKNSVAGPQDCWLLTANRLQVVAAQVKMCVNPQCLAIHSFNDIFTGLFNVGNKMLVSLDLLFSIRNEIKLGEDPRVAISSILGSVQEQADKILCAEELAAVQELLSCGYWAFECLTIRDYNDMICGVCGVAPKVEIAQRNKESTLTLNNIEFTWPEFLSSNDVSMEDFWSTLETEVLEQAAFPSSIPITKFDASILSPFFPPLMHGPVVVNSESFKNLEVQKVPGNASTLVKLLQEGSLKLDQMNLHSKEELQNILSLCGIPWNSTDTKDQMCYSLLTLSEFIQNGTQVKQPPSHLTGGKLYKVCPHQVVCGSKYIVRGESPRDHVDLLASSRHWPPVYVVDMATQVALCADLCYPNLTQKMWGKNQGCFSDTSEPPMYVSCPELLDRHYSVDIMGNEPSIQHPVTKSASRRIVHVVAEQNGACDPTSRHHSLSLCRELEPYSAIITAIGDSKTSNIRHHPINFENATHYYLYNRLIDFLTSRDIVNRQIHDIVQTCQPGEVVIRDTLYRLGVAQIKTETFETEVEEDIVPEQLKPV